MLLVCSFVVLSACQQAPESLAQWEHAAAGALDAAISRDGRFALIASVNFGAGYWDLSKNELKFLWTHSDDKQKAITAVNLSPDGSRAITAEDDTFIIWNTNTGRSYGYWQAPAEIRAVAISDKGRYVLLGLGDGRAIHIDMNTGRRLEFTGHRDNAIADVDLSANGLWAFTGGNDYRAILWNTKSGKPLRLFEHETRVTALKLSHDGNYGFSSGTKSNANIWDLRDGAKIAQLELKPREYVISAASFSHDSQWLATGAPGRDVSLWEVKSGKRLRQWRVATRKPGKPVGAIVYAVGFDQSDDYLFSESSAGIGEKWAIAKNLVNK